MKQIRVWKAELVKRIKKPNIKKMLLLALCALLLLLPSISALIYVYHTEHVQQTDLFSVSLYDSAGTLLGSEQGPPDNLHADSLAGIFYRIMTQKKQTSLGGSASEGDPHLLAVIGLNGSTETLTCYFSFVASGGYCTDAKGTSYTIPQALNEQFLSTSYAEPLYASAVVPRLLTIDNEPVLPSSVRWSYQSYDGSFQTASGNPIAAEARSYDMTGEIGILFEIEPSACTVQIYDGEQRIYNGSHRDLSSMTFDSGNELRIKVKATWKRSADSVFYGELQYDFLAMIRNRSVFTLNTEAVSAGGFAILSCTNVNTLSKISFQTDAKIPAPVFHQDGDTARALLVFPADTDMTECSFRVSYGASARSFTVTVTPADEKTEPILLPALADKKTSDGQIRQVWGTLLQSTQASERTGVYFRGNFGDPTLLGFHIGYSHGETVTTDKSDSGWQALGTEYLTDSETGGQVGTLMTGIVIRVGHNNLLGHFVVVDHGCGLRTWYGHLSDTDVEVGEVVATGEAIGKTGSTGLASADGFLLICTIYETAIDPTLIVGKEIPLS